MAAGTYSVPFYPSAVDGLVVSADSYRSNLIPKRQISAFAYPMMTIPNQTSSIPQSYPLRPHVIRSSTGSILQRTPHPYPLTTTVLRSTNVRWDSGINIVDFRTHPLIDPRRSVRYPMSISRGNQFVRSGPLQNSNTYPMNNRFIPKSKLDAKHFCGLAPIQENKLLIRETPSSSTRPPNR